MSFQALYTLLYLISLIMVEQFDFLQIVNSIEKMSNFGHFEVIFLNVNIFSWAGALAIFGYLGPT